MTQQVSIDPTAEVKTSSIGDGTRIWQYTIILDGATIGKDVNICSHCFVENDVVVGAESGHIIEHSVPLEFAEVGEFFEA